MKRAPVTSFRYCQEGQPNAKYTSMKLLHWHNIHCLQKAPSAVSQAESTSSDDRGSVVNIEQREMQ